MFENMLACDERLYNKPRNIFMLDGAAVPYLEKSLYCLGAFLFGIVSKCVLVLENCVRS